MAPRKTKKKGKKVVLGGAGMSKGDESIAATAAPSLQDNREVVQPSLDSASTPISDPRESEVLHSIQPTGVPVSDPKDEEVVVNVQPATIFTSQSPPRSSVGINLAQEEPPAPVVESNVTRSKRKRNRLSTEVDLEEPPPKRVALPGDQLEVSNVPQQPKPAKRAYNKKKKSSATFEDGPQAEPSVISGEAFSLSCSLKGEPGNLILSPNQRVVEFYGLAQLPVELPRYSLLISDLTKRPITSARKSNPMCIRVKGKNDPRGSDFAFAVSQSDEGYAEMHEMRAKIVAATIQTAFQGPVAATHETNEKPYQCEKCGLRFRNKNGREYHLEKSQTICNPDHDPSKITKKKRGGRKKGVATKPKKADLDFDSEEEDEDEAEPEMEIDANELDSGMYDAPILGGDTEIPITRTPGRAEHTRKGLVDNGDVDSSSSEDSIFEWVRTTATKSTTRRPRRVGSREASEPRLRYEVSTSARISKPMPEKTPTTKRYKNLKGEAPFFAAIVEELSRQDASAVVPNVLAAPSVIDGQLNTEACEKIFLNLCVENGGIFPGDKSIWFALVAVWLKDYRNSQSKPESKHCSYILDTLVESGKLKRLEFSFKDVKSRHITRSVYVCPDYDNDDKSFGLMKESIKAAHPGFYVPESSRPPEHVLVELEKLVTRPVAATSVQSEKSSEEPESPGDFDDEDEDEFQMEETPSMDDEEFILGGVMDSIEDDLFEVETTTSRPTKNQKISDAIKKWHADRRAAGLTYPSKRKITTKQVIPGPPVRRGLTKEEKEKLYLEEASSPCWGAAAPAFLPNPATGAWDSKPLRVKAPPTAISSKPRGIGAGFAEPITYLQTENGAWSHRAYGHGVKPIYSRPSKRVEGNPASAAYLAKIGSGFRPIVYPTKNMVHGPAPFSKSRAFQDGVPEPRTRRKRTANLLVDGSQEVDPSDPSFTPGDRDSDSDFEATKRLDVFKDLVPKSVARRKKQVDAQVTNSATPVPDFDEVEVLNYIEPKKLPAGSTQNPGLSSLPHRFGDLSAEYDPFAVNQITFPFPEPVLDDSGFQDGSWVSIKRGPRKRTYDKIRFDEQTAFTLETLPYGQLDDFSHDENEQPPAKRVRYSESQSIELEPAPAKKAARVKKLKPTRPLTALPTDFDGLTEDPIAMAKYLGVQMVQSSMGDQVRKRLRVGNRMSKSEEKRFIVTVIVIRTITGGIDQYIDWVLVSTLFPDFSMNHLNKVWTQIIKKKIELIDEMVTDFQDAFLVAYREGKVKSINFDNLLKYDWARLVRWTMKNVNTSLTKKAVKLPANREDLLEEYIYNEIDNENGEAQRLFFGLTCPIYRRLDAVAAKQLAIPIKRIEAPGDGDIDELTKAKSFARASALTPIETWNWSIAKDKLTQLSSGLLESAIESLKEQRIIIKRNKAKSTTGRIYEASDAFAAPLRKPIKAEIFLQAFRYKEFLDSEFGSGKETIRVDYFGDEGSYMCVTSLMAAGRLKVTGLNIPVAPMGLGDDAHPYDTKRIPKSRVKWDIDMSPSDSYLYNEDNETFRAITDIEPPSSRSGAIPAWNGIGDVVIPDLWKRILCAVTSTVALRTGISKKGLQMTFKPTLEEWEIGLFMKWGEEAKLFERLDEDKRIDGWCVSEHFWLCLGRMVEFLEEMEVDQKEEASERLAEVERERQRGRDRDWDD